MKPVFAFCAMAVAAAALAAKPPAETAPPPAGTDQPAAGDQPAPKPRLPRVAEGTVLETMDVSTYTYVHVDVGPKKLWAASPKFAVKKGDRVRFATGMPMLNFHSKELDRTFEVVFFTGRMAVLGDDGKAGAGTGANPHMPAGHPQIPGAGGNVPAGHPAFDRAPAAPPPTDFSDIKKPFLGKTVADVHEDKAALNGKTVKVRGKVTAVSANILGRNWLHVRDGTGTKGTDDLIVITDAPGTVGDTVLVKGRLVADKDLGYGYRYDVVLEDAEVTVEKAAAMPTPPKTVQMPAIPEFPKPPNPPAPPPTPSLKDVPRPTPKAPKP